MTNPEPRGTGQFPPDAACVCGADDAEPCLGSAHESRCDVTEFKGTSCRRHGGHKFQPVAQPEEAVPGGLSPFDASYKMVQFWLGSVTIEDREQAFADLETFIAAVRAEPPREEGGPALEAAWDDFERDYAMTSTEQEVARKAFDAAIAAARAPGPVGGEALEVAAEAVHQAWMLEKQRQGFAEHPLRDGFTDGQCCTASGGGAGRHHPHMVPWRELDDSAREFDRVTARAALAARAPWVQ